MRVVVVIHFTHANTLPSYILLCLSSLSLSLTLSLSLSLSLQLSLSSVLSSYFLSIYLSHYFSISSFFISLSCLSLLRPLYLFLSCFSLSFFYAFLSLLQPLYLVRSFFITLPLTLSFHILDSDFLFSLCYVSLLLFVSVT